MDWIVNLAVVALIIAVNYLWDRYQELSRYVGQLERKLCFIHIYPDIDHDYTMYLCNSKRKHIKIEPLRDNEVSFITDPVCYNLSSCARDYLYKLDFYSVRICWLIAEKTALFVGRSLHNHKHYYQIIDLTIPQNHIYRITDRCENRSCFMTQFNLPELMEFEFIKA